MSNPIQLRRAGLVLAVATAFAAVPVAAQASQVDLGTAGAFVALGGSTVTNTGPSVLNGDLGVAPGTALVGFGLPAVVNGATHANDGVAQQAQLDLTTAYNVAAGQPVAPANDLTGTNLGNRTLTAGAYRFTSSAQLTGALTLDAQGDPNAQFVFEIASTLITAPASSVVLINGASPCNVYWQVGSSATLDSTTVFQGNLMALADISLNNAATVTGRLLAQTGQISLINNVLNLGGCPTGSTSIPGGTGTATGTATGTGSTGSAPTASRSALTTRNGTAVLRRNPRTPASATTPGSPNGACTAGFSARVRGHLIKRVVFSLDGRRIASRVTSPFQVYVRAAPGRHRVSARVTFKDATRAKTLSLPYRACAAALRQPRPGPSQFTG
jgi:Ice-binding-like